MSATSKQVGTAANGHSHNLKMLLNLLDVTAPRRLQLPSEWTYTSYGRDLAARPLKRKRKDEPAKRRHQWHGRSSDHATTFYNTPLAENKSLNVDSLTPEQKYVFDLAINQRKSIFFTGSAGTGKSYLLHQMCLALQEKHGKEHVAITASTGIAAYNIGGVTVHR
ncbi:hypothetical protein DM01DRAFT_1134073 [Hesseltinella vesiculosa]|uniref:ATP-dependent DNA helicase n=1 Tax=Hesseltinella vesiculosa TaxID=101127 RepID=A0A1X2G8R7_9FUNG|nr:hypothetical protein DM01DRAFT_1134073 [Hesseltinella vesiculosa]